MWRRFPGDGREYRDSRHRRAFRRVAGLGIPRSSAASLRPQGVIYIKVWHGTDAEVITGCGSLAARTGGLHRLEAARICRRGSEG